MYALLIRHLTKTGCRNQVESVWEQHMQPAITANPGHLAYVYSFGEDAETIVAFQVYASREAANAFVKSDAYLSYVEASRPLLAQDAEVTVLDTRWMKFDLPRQSTAPQERSCQG